MIQTGETEILGGKPLPMPLVHNISNTDWPVIEPGLP
jgi:hypothetical protein